MVVWHWDYWHHYSNASDFADGYSTIQGEEVVQVVEMGGAAWLLDWSRGIMAILRRHISQLIWSGYKNPSTSHHICMCPSFAARCKCHSALVWPLLDLQRALQKRPYTQAKHWKCIAIHSSPTKGREERDILLHVLSILFAQYINSMHTLHLPSITSLIMKL